MTTIVAIAIPSNMWTKIQPCKPVSGAKFSISLMLRDEADCYVPSTWLARFVRIDGQPIWFTTKPTNPKRLQQLESIGFDIYNDFEVTL